MKVNNRNININKNININIKIENKSDNFQKIAGYDPTKY